MNKAILLSGGMDSVCLAYWKRPEIAITIDYGQAPAQTEIRTSTVIAKALGIQHHIISIDCKQLGSGDLLNAESLAISPSTEWWPFRNQLLVTFALMKAIKLHVNELMVASVRTDGFHKDGTPNFYQLISDLSAYQEGNIKVNAPCIDFSTSQLVKVSGIPKDLLFWAHSCHKSNIACGNCTGCYKYYQVLTELGYV